MQKAAYTVDSFCEAYCFSKAQFYLLLKAGKMPRTYMIGNRRYISMQAAEEWQKKMEAETATGESAS